MNTLIYCSDRKGYSCYSCTEWKSLSAVPFQRSLLVGRGSKAAACSPEVLSLTLHGHPNNFQLHWIQNILVTSGQFAALAAQQLFVPVRVRMAAPSFETARANKEGPRPVLCLAAVTKQHKQHTQIGGRLRTQDFLHSSFCLCPS